MLRIALFFATNIAILVVISIVFSLLGLEGILAENQVDLNLQALLVMSAVIGFFVAITMVVKTYWYKIKSIFSGKKTDDHDENAKRQEAARE